MLIDKNIHRNEFRLRLLVTNGCNSNCAYCLNDFQPKPAGPADLRYLPYVVAINAINAYVLCARRNQVDPIVTFSGGEPGLWSDLFSIAQHAKIASACVKMCTNGTALEEKTDPYVDTWHISVVEKYALPSWLPRSKVVVQFVVLEATTVEEMSDVVTYYHPIPVKFFVDFFSQNKESLYQKIDAVVAQLPLSRVSSRHTGQQENRGIACAGCTRECVTLKGVWVFPDGIASTCPQGVVLPQRPETLGDWDALMQDSYAKHNEFCTEIGV